MPGIAAVWTPTGRPFGTADFTRVLRTLDARGCEPLVINPAHGPCFIGAMLQSYLPQDVSHSISRPGVVLIADCRLDYRVELAHELGLTAQETLSDTSLLTLAWLQWGETCVEHLAGCFAFAVWNPDSQVLFAARDPVGECPLFFYHCPDLIAVASRPAALLTAIPAATGHTDRAATFNDQHIAHWLALNPPERHTTFFAEITRLPPGCAVRLTPDRAHIRQYWHPSDARPVRFRTDGEYAEAMRDILDRATGERLRSRGEASAQLSSGLDSSSVATSAAIQLAPLGRGLTAYTSVPQTGFADTHRNTNIYFDEGPFAAQVAAMYPNMRHVRVSSQGLPFFSTVKRWTDAMDEPILNGTNIVWIDTILRLARENGSDILFQGAMGNGNISYETLRILAHLLRQGHWLKLANTIYRHRASGFLSLRQAARATFQDLYPARFSRDVQARREAFSLDYSPINEEFSRQYSVAETTLDRHLVREPDIATERRDLYERFDLGPQNAAARTLHQVDPRDPTSDKLVWDYTYAIPPEQFIAGGHSRSLIRRAMQGRLPANTLARYARGHQGADWYFNVRAALPELRAELEELQSSPAAQRYLDLPRLQHLIETFPTQDFQRARVFNPYHFALVRGLTLGYFLRRHERSLNASA